jgi:predicted nucleic acid-binding protein
MNNKEFFLDVNVPMYAAGRDHPYKKPCAWVMTEIAKGRMEAAIDTETIQEILYRYGALREWQVAVSMANNLLTILPKLYPLHPADIRLAVKLFEQYAHKGVTARDVVHVAVMKNNGLTKIISTDAHFDLIEGITRLDPKALFAESEADGK